MKIRNPRTGLLDYEISPLRQSALKKKTIQLRAAQTEWANLGIEYRIEVLQNWKKAVENHKSELIDAICTDTGRHWETLLEVDLIASSIDRWCKISRDFFTPQTLRQSSIPFISIEQDVVPYALVGVISPWNFPLLLSLIDTIPALLAGSAVIVKPSEVTPRFIKILEKTILEVPALHAVLAYVEGDGKTGSHIVELSDIVCFTGSTATGKKVYQKAARLFKPVFLELGGKDAAVVFESADLDHATSAILWGSTANAGQSCLSIERVYVQESVFQPFLELLIKKAQQLNLGYPDMEKGKIGPIISEKQVEIIDGQLKDALEKGAKVEYGSPSCANLGGGLYCLPTILTHVNSDMQIMREETFGPIIPLMPFKNTEEALALANSTSYGLSAAVFSGNIEESIAFGKKLTVGAVSIQEAALTAVMHEGEKNAFKMSGIGGTRMGASAIKRFMRQKAFLVKTQPLRAPWWFG
jgi:succinate-semialdehyde dehydrogenase / glutarate-semialdehyde dehydrogenase